MYALSATRGDTTRGTPSSRVHGTAVADQGILGVPACLPPSSVTVGSAKDTPCRPSSTGLDEKDPPGFGDNSRVSSFRGDVTVSPDGSGTESSPSRGAVDGRRAFLGEALVGSVLPTAPENIFASRTQDIVDEVSSASWTLHDDVNFSERYGQHLRRRVRYELTDMTSECES